MLSMSAEDKLVMEKTFQMLDEDKVGFSLSFVVLDFYTFFRMAS